MNKECSDALLNRSYRKNLEIDDSYPIMCGIRFSNKTKILNQSIGV